MAAQIVLPARRGKVCEVLRLPVAFCEVLLPKRPGTGFLGFWLLEQDSNL